MLTDAEQDQYNTYANQIDDALLQKFIKRLPVKFAIWTIVAVATGTIGIPILFALRWMFRVAKNDRARSYIVQLQKKYNCKEINWETFPAHSVVLGEKRKAGSDSCGQLCPICQTHSLYRSFYGKLKTDPFDRRVQAHRLCSTKLSDPEGERECKIKWLFRTLRAQLTLPSRPSGAKAGSRFGHTWSA